MAERADYWRIRLTTPLGLSWAWQQSVILSVDKDCFKAQILHNSVSYQYWRNCLIYLYFYDLGENNSAYMFFAEMSGILDPRIPSFRRFWDGYGYETHWLFVHTHYGNFKKDLHALGDLLYFGIFFGKSNIWYFPSIVNFQAGKFQLWHATKYKTSWGWAVPSSGSAVLANLV